MNDLKSMKNCPEGFKVGQISSQGMLICNELEHFIYVNNTSVVFVAYYLRCCDYNERYLDF